MYNVLLAQGNVHEFCRRNPPIKPCCESPRYGHSVTATPTSHRDPRSPLNYASCHATLNAALQSWRAKEITNQRTSKRREANVLLLFWMMCTYCFETLCFALLCVDLRCNEMNFIVLHCFSLLWFPLLCFALLCIALICLAFICLDLRCFDLLCFALLCFALLCFCLPRR